MPQQRTRSDGAEVQLRSSPQSSLSKASVLWTADRRPCSSRAAGGGESDQVAGHDAKNGDHVRRVKRTMRALIGHPGGGACFHGVMDDSRRGRPCKELLLGTCLGVSEDQKVL